MTINVIRLLIIARETREIAGKVIPLMMTKELLDKVPLEKIETFMNLANKLSNLLDGIVPSDRISLKETTQNNFEFLDTMRTVLFLILKYSDVQESEYIKSLQARTDELIAELNSPPFLQHRKQTLEASDDFLQDSESDEDLTEPFSIMFICCCFALV